MLTLLAGEVPLLQNTEFWVGLAFVAFLLILAYYGIPGMITRALDKRADTIRREIDDARKLREEAQALLADYRRRAARAETEANDIVVRAQAEAKRAAEETRQALQESLERRTKQAEEKIARAEAQAVSEVRAVAVDRSIEVAEELIRARATSEVKDSLISSAIAAVPSRLN